MNVLTAAQSELVEAHLDNAYKTAARQFRRYSPALQRKLCFDDLLSEAYVGLVEAAQGYDSTQGTTFITYAFMRMQFRVRRVYQQLRRDQGWIRVKEAGSTTLLKSEKRFDLVQWPDYFGSTVDPLRPNVLEPAVPAVQGNTAPTSDTLRAHLLTLVSTARDTRILTGLMRGESMRVIAADMGITYQRVSQLWGALRKRLEYQIARSCPHAIPS